MPVRGKDSSMKHDIFSMICGTPTTYVNNATTIWRFNDNWITEKLQSDDRCFEAGNYGRLCMGEMSSVNYPILKGLSL